jgi:hypothetical protein
MAPVWLDMKEPVELDMNIQWTNDPVFWSTFSQRFLDL